MLDDPALGNFEQARERPALQFEFDLADRSTPGTGDQFADIESHFDDAAPTARDAQRALHVGLVRSLQRAGSIAQGVGKNLRGTCAGVAFDVELRLTAPAPALDPHLVLE